MGNRIPNKSYNISINFLFSLTDWEKDINIYFIHDLFMPNEHDNASTIRFVHPATLFEIEMVEMMTQYLNNAKYKRLRGHRLVIHHELTDTERLALGFYKTFLSPERSIRPDIFLGPAYEHNLFRIYGGNVLFNTLLVSHGASSIYFDKNGETLDIARASPSDFYRMTALMALIRYFKWNYLNVFASIRLGDLLSKFFHQMSKDHCVSTYEIDAGEYDKLCKWIQKLSKEERNRIIVLITYADDSRRVLKCMHQLALYDRFQLIFFNNHNVDPIVSYGNERLLDGAISLRAYFGPLKFDAIKYVTETLRKGSKVSKKDIMAVKAKRAYWESRNHCYAASGFNNRELFDRECTFDGNETLEPERGWDNVTLVSEQMPFLFVTMYRIGQLLGQFFNNHCEKYSNNSSWLRDCNRSYVSEGNGDGVWGKKLIDTAEKLLDESLNFHRAIRKTTFYVDNTRYDNLSETITNRQVFRWSIVTGETFNHDPLYFVNKYENEFLKLELPWWGVRTGYEPPFGNCSRKCDYGTIRAQHDDNFVCCWTCIPCDTRQISNSNQTRCETCSRLEMANNVSDKCLPLRVVTITESHLLALTIQRWAIYGEFIMVIGICIFMIVHRDTTILRSSGLELWVGIVFCIMLSLVGALGYTMEPSTLVCVLRSLIAPLFSMAIYAFMITKAVRIGMSFRGTSKISIIYSMFPKSLAAYHLSAIYIGLPLLSLIVFCSCAMNKRYKLAEYTVHTKKAFLTTHCSPPIIFYMHLPNLPVGLLAVGQLHRLWNLPQNFSETKDLLVATCVSSFFTALSFCFYFIETEYVYLMELTSLFHLIVNALWLMVALFGRKMYFAHTRHEASEKNHNIFAIRARSFSANTSGKLGSVDEADGLRVRIPLTSVTNNPYDASLRIQSYTNAGSPPLTNYLCEEARL